MNKWQDLTDMEVNRGEWIHARYARRSFLFQILLRHCLIIVGMYFLLCTEDISSLSFSEFLVHAADVEGLCQGIDKELVASR